ncbi:sn-glycerol-1-phosphate dehydrogenase [Halobacillus sp. B23F22_1]|uniref:sn-glycerol-1-phosphate dehydrogenase n=1 Tax=Halobacillus sp. B23F22_1 TaxID=3459514 RepID=UPI00373F3774
MQYSDDLLQLAEEVRVDPERLPKLDIRAGSLLKSAEFIKEKRFQHAVLVIDENTKQAAGNALYRYVTAEGIKATVVELAPNSHGQIIADEPTIIQLMVDTPSETDVLLAVGSGTIHDITRFCSEKMNLPFISIPTAASVDGFTSKGAPLILKGVKKTIQTTSPIAVFADLNVLCAAPQDLSAAGFGDILGKYTSLLDWQISQLVADEPYSASAAKMTRNSLERCVKNAEKIARADEKGLTILMEALIESGLVMLLLDFSRPASGGEHHLSHYWEMDLLQKDAPQLLHGAKVGIAASIITDLYKQWAENFNPDLLSQGERYEKELNEHWYSIKTEIEALPDAKVLRDYLEQTGGPSRIQQLGVSESLVEKSLNEAFHLRDRCTGLFLINQIKSTMIPYPLRPSFYPEAD